MYNLKIINKKEVWNDFIINSNIEFYSFVDSFEWWNLQELEWNKIFRYWIYDDKKLIWLFLLIKVFAKRWIYLFTPHWPLIMPEYNFFEVLKWLKQELKSIWKEQKASFIRLNSTQKNTKENAKNFKNLWFLNAPMHIHAEDTHLLDLEKSEEELLKNIKKEDRYYINRAIKEWVEIRIDNQKDHIETLINYHHNHANRENWKNKYHAFSISYINNLYKIFDEKDINTISASYNWKIESILMTIRFWKTAVYYIASSDIVSKKFSPNYLCQWSAILNAKRNWCKIYNFWWVSPDDNPNHPIAWVTKFKRKFWWYDYNLIHAQDLIISNKYWINWLIESIRRKKRWYYYKKPE